VAGHWQKATELLPEKTTSVALGWREARGWRGAHFLKHDALAVRRAAEGVALELRTQVSLLVRLVRPAVLPAQRAQLARSVDSTRLTGTHDF
jgi:hypothetical protein